jgi:hypothetical protein
MILISQAQQFDGSSNPVIAVKGAKVSDFGGKWDCTSFKVSIVTIFCLILVRVTLNFTVCRSLSISHGIQSDYSQPRLAGRTHVEGLV